jgi:hypothetical protein
MRSILVDVKMIEAVSGDGFFLIPLSRVIIAGIYLLVLFQSFLQRFDLDLI